MTAELLLETERLQLCGWREDQLDDLVRLHGDRQIARYLTDSGEPWDRGQAAASLKSWIALFQQHRMGKLRIIRKQDGVLVGRAGYSLYPPTGEPELGFALFREHWGNGYATEAAGALRDWIFRETDWDHFIGFADLRNHASLAVLRRVGMVPTHIEEMMGFGVQFHVLRKADLP